MRVIGHRGAAALAPENTIPSFVAAVQGGVSSVEFDVRLTADGHAVVIHDDDVSRTTDGVGTVSRMTFAALRRLNAAARYDGWDEPVQVPTFDEVLEVVAGKAGLVIEVKASFDETGFRSGAPVVEAIADRVRDLPDVMLSSFDPFAVETARRLLPDMPTALTIFLGFPLEAALTAVLAAGHRECHVPEAMITGAFIDRAHAAGITVASWTVNDPVRAAELRALGLDGIFTDDPIAIADALEGGRG